MEIISAKVIEKDDLHFIQIEDKTTIKIPISDDDPKEVKKAFNKLLLRLKKGLFEIELPQEADDLFCQVAQEYLKQLNGELREVHNEMKEHGLTN